MTSGLAVLGHMVVIRLDSLGDLQYYKITGGTTGANLIGGGTSDELMAEVTLVLGSGLVLNIFTINVTQRLSQEAYLVEGLSMFVVVAEPVTRTHADDVYTKCAGTDGKQVTKSKEPG